jgi:hypothetical protein
MLLCVAALTTACDENAVQDISSPEPIQAGIRFINFGNGAPNVNFYANDRKMTAVTSTTPGVEATVGTAFGSFASGGFYSSIAPGTYSLTGRIAAATDKNLAIGTVSATIAAGKYYSMYLAGNYNTATKTVDAFVVEDVFPETFDYSVAYVRFVNGIFNSTPLALYIRNPTSGVETKINGEVAYKSASAFQAVPGAVYNISVRTAGSSTNAIARDAVSFVAGRVYTISGRGDITVTSATAANRAFLDNTANR